LSTATVAVAWVLTVALRTTVSGATFVFFYGAVALAGTMGGLVSGAAAVLLSAVIGAAFLLPPSIPGSGMARGVVIAAFIAVASLVAYLTASLRRARRDAEAEVTVALTETAEMTTRQQDTEEMAEELEHANAQLEEAIDEANRARDLAEASEAQLRLLDEASRVLAGSLDYEVTVAAVAQLAVPELAEWCTVDVLVDGAMRQIALAHVDPEKVKWARELGTKYPQDPNTQQGVPEVIRTGEAQVYETITDEMLVAAAKDEEHLTLLRSLNMRSAMIVPLNARGKTLGAMTLVGTNEKQHYDARDLALAREIAHRAALAIDNAQLYRAARVANEAKANFLATMSHELRTPLTAIIGYEELLAEGITGPVNDAQRQQLDRVKVSAQHLLSLIDEILTYARVEAGKESVRIERVVVKGVVDDAVAFLVPTAAEKGIAVRAEGVDPSLMTQTDPGKLRQILVNLLSNAVKFTERGAITVRAVANDGDVILEVADTGVGIAPEHLQHIFDPFWQVEQHTTRRAGGSGLGLSVTRNLARLLGGEITVESTLGKESTFRVRIPRR
jgi:signal transduction histidine kinase